MNQHPFGEGKQRFGCCFYELGQDVRSIVGKALVAKESRYIQKNNLGNELAHREYAQRFCKMQQLAKCIANEFNAELDWLHCVDDRTPRIKMLKCCIHEIDGISIDKLSVLVKRD